MGNVGPVGEISTIHPRPLPKLTKTQTTASLLQGIASPNSGEPPKEVHASYPKHALQDFMKSYQLFLTPDLITV